MIFKNLYLFHHKMIFNIRTTVQSDPGLAHPDLARPWFKVTIFRTVMDFLGFFLKNFINITLCFGAQLGTLRISPG